MKLAFVTFLLFAFYGTARVYGQDVLAPSPVPYQPVYVAPCIGCVPPVIYQPQVIYHPYQYQRTDVQQMQYRTPVRDWFFGRYRINHVYAPTSPQVAR